MTKIPNLFLIGAAKAGTTALWQVLRGHPSVFMSDPKELRFFGSDIPAPDYYYLPSSMEEYLSFFSGATDERVVGEASPSYLLSKTAALELRDFNPDAKVVAIIRNPVDAMLSHHAMWVHSGVETITDFEQALAAQDSQSNGSRPYWHRYRDVVRYTEQLKRYFDVFPRKQMHVILYDDFKKDPALTYRELLRFLEVDDAFQPDFDVVNASKRTKSRAFQRMLQKPPRVISAVTHGLLSPEQRFRWGRRLGALNSARFQRSSLRPDAHKVLLAQFKDEIERLSLLLDRDLSSWSDS